MLDDLAAHRAPEVPPWAPTHPRWEFAFQPKYAAYPNLTEPGWKTLRSLALKGRCFETREQVFRVLEAATRHGNAHRHPCVWGERKRRRPARPTGIAHLPAAA